MHIGKEIHDMMQTQGRTTVWLARQLGCARTFVYKIYERPSIDTNLLMRISKILDHNFFSDYSVVFNEMRVLQNDDTSSDDEVQ